MSQAFPMPQCCPARSRATLSHPLSSQPFVQARCSLGGLAFSVALSTRSHTPNSPAAPTTSSWRKASVSPWTSWSPSMWRCTLTPSAPTTPSRSGSCIPALPHSSFPQQLLPSPIFPHCPLCLSSSEPHSALFRRGRSKPGCGFSMRVPHLLSPACPSQFELLCFHLSRAGTLQQVRGQSLFIQIQTNRREHGPFCGKMLPPRIETDSNKVTITFTTDESGNHTGWKIHYTSTGEQMALHPGTGKQFLSLRQDQQTT